MRPGLGDRRSRGRARRQCRGRQARRGRRRRTASRSSATSTCRAGSPRPPRASMPGTCSTFLEILIDKNDQDARGQLGRRDRQGDRADPRRRRRASELPAEDRGLRSHPAQQDAPTAQARRSPTALRSDAIRSAMRPPSTAHRSVRLPAVDLRAGGVRRLLRGVVGDAGAAHAADVGDQRDLLGDRGRRAARGRRRRSSRNDPARSGRACSASSR